MGTNTQPNTGHSDTTAQARKPLRLDWLGASEANSTATERRKPDWRYWLTTLVVVLGMVLLTAYPRI